MDYIKTYEKIIEKVKNEKRIKYHKLNKNYIYYELHHIKPKSLFPELSNLKLNPNNGILLTAKEHFICHLLLQKIYGEKMIQAFLKMSGFGKYTSRSYDKKRNDLYFYKFNWYNNGNFNIKVRINEEPPAGFIKGQIRIKNHILKKYPKIEVKEKIMVKHLQLKIKKNGKSVIELYSGKIYSSIKDAEKETGISKFIITKSISNKIPIDNFAFSKYIIGVDILELRRNYEINKIIPYSKIKEKFTGKIFENELQAERFTGISRYFIRKSIIQDIPYKNSHFTLL